MDETRTRRKVLTSRCVLWCHAAAVGCLTVLLYRANGDLHAVQPPVLYLLAIPATLSLYVLPPLALFTVFRETGRKWPPLLAEALLFVLHLDVMAVGFSRY